MMKNIYLKAGLAILMALAMVLPASAAVSRTKDLTTSMTPQPSTKGVIFEDSFETYADFVIAFPPWTLVDVDGSPTFGHSAVSWPNQFQPQAAIIMNPATTTPPQSGPEWLAHTGTKYVACFSEDNTGYISDDWVISPQVTGTYSTVSFWAKSFSNQYQLERFTVGVSTTDTNPSSFTIISPGSYVQPPLTWTEYSYDISSYSGQSIYIGIHDCGVDSWFLQIDDFVISGETTDTTPPVTTCTLEGTMEGDYYITDVTATLTAVDTMSGVNYTMVSVDGGEFGLYADPILITGNGEHTIQYYSVDNVGNVEDTKTTVFEIRYPTPIEITIGGGIGFKATLKNIGTEDLTGVAWSIDLDGGLILIGKHKAGTVDIAAGAEVTVKTFVVGFGATGILVKANTAEETGQGSVILIFGRVLA